MGVLGLDCLRLQLAFACGTACISGTVCAFLTFLKRDRDLALGVPWFLLSKGCFLLHLAREELGGPGQSPHEVNPRVPQHLGTRTGTL